MSELLNKHLGGRWGFLAAGQLIPGERVSGWVQAVESDSGRPVIGGLLLLAEDAITAEMLRKIPVATLENGVAVGLDSEAARAALQRELEALPPLERTEDMTPEAFSALLAEHFKAWAKAVPHPAAAMAAHANVKPPTMHTWIREARLRGLLPPAKRKKGRAG